MKSIAIIFLILGALLVVVPGRKSSPAAENQAVATGLGSVDTLLASYREWEAAYVKNGGDRNMVLPLGFAKGLSTEHSAASGSARLDLIDGAVAVEVRGFPKAESFDVWLIDNQEGPGLSVLPEPGDTMLRLGNLALEGKTAKLKTKLGRETLRDFKLDLIAVTRAGKNPVEHRLLLGSPTLFHRLYRSGQRGEFGALGGRSGWETARPLSLPDRFFGVLVPTAQAQIGPIPNPSTALELMITRGRRSFFNETFNGNGRTCGTCHREDNNLTIDPEFIATLPPNDPLFVAEFLPALAHNFENPVLMRKFGLILENPDGFGDLGNTFVMRGVPHTLALLQNTLTPVAGGADGTTIPPNERTGWGGDGAPNLGTLRDFIVGAITQHYPKTLARLAGSDFRLPTPGELDDLEAFQRSTGRRQDLVLTGPGALSLKSEVGRRGQQIFNNPGPPGFPGFPEIPNVGAGKCFFCHVNAGASSFFFPGQNANFNTNVEGLPSQAADLVIPPQLNQADGGFGRIGFSPTGGIGTGLFNTPVVVEAADTGPFFHNNAIATIEGAVAFYNSAAFNTAPGFGATVGGINLEPTEVEAVAAFLRLINALENIRSSLDLEQRAKLAANFPQAQELLKLSISEIEDAIEVLRGAGLHPEARKKLLRAAALDAVALVTFNTSLRNSLINQAIALKNAARADMAF